MTKDKVDLGGTCFHNIWTDKMALNCLFGMLTILPASQFITNIHNCEGKDDNANDTIFYLLKVCYMSLNLKRHRLIYVWSACECKLSE